MASPSSNGARLLDGNAVADAIQARAADRLTRAGKPPVTLATVLVGENAPSRLYVNLKLKRAAAAGIKSRLIEMPDNTTQAQLEQRLTELAGDDAVHGILLQLPLPDGLDTRAAIEKIPTVKDVDGLTRGNLGALVCGEPGLVPCTPLGVMRILEHYGLPTAGRRAVVVGRSYVVGLTQALLLARKGTDATPTLCHSRTRSLAKICRGADVLIAATGAPGLITRACVKAGAVVIDVGVTHTDEGIRGDVAFDEVAAVAGYLTPMPGGTGPVTVACLIENTLSAAKMQGALGDEPGRPERALDAPAGAGG